MKRTKRTHAAALLPYRAADAPISGVVIAPPADRTSDHTPHSPYSSGNRRKKPPDNQSHQDEEIKKPRDDGHLVDDYA